MKTYLLKENMTGRGVHPYVSVTMSALLVLVFLLSFNILISAAEPSPEELSLAEPSPADPMWSGPVRGTWVLADYDRDLVKSIDSLSEAKAIAGALKGVILALGDESCEIVVGRGEHSAVHKAAEFLSDDIFKISGSWPMKVSKPSGDVPVIYFATLGVTPVPDAVAKERLQGEWEAFQIITVDGDIWLVGSDFRGTAFAGYTLSERLGIDPLYLWTGYEPERYNPLILKEVNYLSPSPTFKYRGTFHDDEDILPRPLDEKGYPSMTGEVPFEWYMRYFETALRLKMNMVAPYTRVTRWYEIQRTASDWGLIYTSHHYDILLSNPFGLTKHGLAAERGVVPVWDWFSNREGMVRYWQAGVLENRELDCIWPVGLRGVGDVAYDFPSGTSEEEKDRIYQEVIDEQIKIVRDLLPEGKEPVLHFTIYGEMLERYKRGGIRIPEDVILVWPDNSLGRMLALPTDTDHPRNGVYYHLAFAPTTLQITHAVHPWRVAQEFRRIVDAGATEFMLVNVSEERDYIKELRMIADICWDAESALSYKDPAKQYIEWWCREYFGEEAAADAAEAYAYYDKIIDNHNRLRYASDILFAQIDELLKKVAGDEYKLTSNDRILELERRNAEYEKAMQVIGRAMKKMGRPERQFFFENLIGLYIDYRQTQAALMLHDALKEPDMEKAWNYIEAAMEPLERLEVEILRAERPPFEQWYRETWLRERTSSFNVHRSYLALRLFIISDGREKLLY